MNQIATQTKRTFAKIATAAALTVGAASSAFAVGPSAGDLSNLTPDSATILTAVGAVAVVMLGVTLAIFGYRKVKEIMGR